MASAENNIIWWFLIIDNRLLDVPRLISLVLEKVQWQENVITMSAPETVTTTFIEK